MKRRKSGIALAALILFLSAQAGLSSEPARYDVIIRGGLVYDGSSSAPKREDVGIRGDRIAALGDLQDAAGKVIDARGLIVSPGFIDVHTHVDLDFVEAGPLDFLAALLPQWKGNYNYLYQGVTTVVSGNCGYGFTDTEAWFRKLKAIGFGTNVYHLAPQGAIREELFGKEQPGELSPAQLERFEARIEEEMEKGALGLSTGLAYAPGYLSGTRELVELAKVVARHGGVYATHTRSYASDPGPDGEPAVLEGIAEAIEIGREAKVPVQLSHLQIQIGTRYPKVGPEQLTGLIEKARSEGLDVTADQYPYAAGYTVMTVLLPDRFKSPRGVKDEFRTEAGKAEIEAAAREAFVDTPPEKILMLDGPFAGKTLAEAAARAGKDPAVLYADLARRAKSPTAVLFQQDMDNVRRLAAHDCVFTASDGLTHLAFAMKAHPRMYGTFTRKIRQFALDEKLIGLNDAIRSMTSLPARKFRMSGRGEIKVGNYADIAVIDLDRIDDPATYRKADVYSRGIDYLLVNGTVEISGGKATGKLGGRPCRKGE